MKQMYYYFWLLLISLLSLGALYGGLFMLIDPSGEALKMPITMLENSPFHDYLIPGIILFIFFGLFPILLLRALVKNSYSRFFEGLNILTDMHWAWTFVIYLSIALIIWIQVQMEIIGEVHWIHTLYTLWGLAMIALGLMPGIRKRYRKS